MKASFCPWSVTTMSLFGVKQTPKGSAKVPSVPTRFPSGFRRRMERDMASVTAIVPEQIWYINVIQVLHNITSRMEQQ